MKKIILAALLSLLFFVHQAQAIRICKWDAPTSTGYACLEVHTVEVEKPDGSIVTRYYATLDGVDIWIESEAWANSHGYYQVTEVYQVADITDEDVWSFADSQITLAFGQNTINSELVEEMEIGQYWIWKVLLTKGVLTSAEAQAILPQNVIDAYMARQAMGQ